MKDYDYSKISRCMAGTPYPESVEGPDINLFEIKYLDSSEDASFWSRYEPYEHRHSFYELHLIVSGMQTYKIGQEKHRVNSGSLLLIPPGHLHSIPECSSILHKFATSFYKISPAQSSYDWVWETFSNPLFVPDADEYIMLFHLIFHLAKEGKLCHRAEIRNLFSVLITHMAEQKRKTTEERPADKSNNRVLQTEQFIRDNLDRPLDTKTLASYIHISERQLNRNVLAEKGMTVKKLIDKIRFDTAVKLMRNETNTISEVCRMTGFSDETTFNRFFKRMSGMPPGKWRKQL